MYTKVYGCTCWWSSCVSVYFLIRCWFMWSYIIWYDCAKGFSMYTFTRSVNHFIVSRTEYVRFILLLGVAASACGAYIIYITGGYTWNDLLHSSRPHFCRDSDNAFTDIYGGRCCSLSALACLGRSAISLLPYTFYLLKIRGNCLCIQILTKLLICCVQLCGLLCLFCLWGYSDTTYSVCVCIWLPFS